MYARVFPSGAHRGARSLPAPDVASQLSPLPRSASQIRLWFRFSSRVGVLTLKATRRPSGESWGSDTARTARNFSMVSGARVCAESPEAAASIRVPVMAARRTNALTG